MPSNYREIGYTGLSTSMGTVSDDFLRELRGLDGYKRYNEMRLNSPVIGALLLAIEQSIRGCTWTFEAENENDPRIEILDAARAGMTQGWNDFISEALTMLPFGWSMFEIVYQRDELTGAVTWRKFAIRGQDTLDRWEFDNEGGIKGMWQQVTSPTWQRTFLPIEKCLLFRTRVERGNPEGRSMLRSAWVPYYYCKNIQRFEAIGIERDLAGMPVIHLPEGASTDSGASSDSSVAAKMVRNVRRDEQEGIVLPPGWIFELVSSGGSRQFDTDAIISRYESRMLMSALAQFLMLGQENVGSLALSRDQTDFFTMSVNACADIIAETFSKYAIPRLLAMRGMDAEGVKLVHSQAGDVDLDAISKFLATVKEFLTWTAQDEIWLRNLADMPEIDEQTITDERARKVQEAQNAMQRRNETGQDEERQEEVTTARNLGKLRETLEAIRRQL